MSKAEEFVRECEEIGGSAELDMEHGGFGIHFDAFCKLPNGDNIGITSFDDGRVWAELGDTIIATKMDPDKITTYSYEAEDKGFRVTDNPRGESESPESVWVVWR